MPTGYTSRVQDGISFEEFVLTCARQFGPLISMKEEPLDAKIPDEFEPNKHYLEKIKEIEEKLEQLQYITEGEAEVKSQREYEKQMKDQIDCLYKKREIKRKYENMLSQVQSWEPPTEDHTELKNFMIQQLQDSIKHDCNEEIVYEFMPKEPMTGKEWINFWTNELRKDLDYYQRKYQDEVNNAKKRTWWVKKLKESLSK